MITRRSLVKAGALSLVALIAAPLAAQSVTRRNSRVGTIQAIEHGDSYITISGINYGYSDEVVHVYLDGEEVDLGILDEGLVVRFTVNEDNVVENVDLLGPAARIDAYFEH